VRIGIGHRALALRETDHVCWFWIGSHADYDELLQRLWPGVAQAVRRRYLPSAVDDHKG
jgi:hypothetical protein